MRSVLIASLLIVTACGAELADSGGQIGPDPGAGGVDAAIGAAIDADAITSCSNRVVYLNFDGVTLTRGVSDATANRASWLEDETTTAPPFRNNSASRASDIVAITSGVRTQLAGIGVMVTTARPATGQYVMVVFGGTTNQVASRFSHAVNELDCGDGRKNDVAWISDVVTSNQRVINLAVGAIGFGLGLTATTLPTDCMCGWDNACISNNTAACALTENISRDPAANQRCAGLTVQSETTAFTQAFCQ